MPIFTPGPWRSNGWAILSDAPVVDGPLGCDDVEHLGGYLIAESVASGNLALIAAAPDLYEALKNIENDNGNIPPWLWDMRNKALAKAEGM